jgi:hypothetical protein
LKLRGTTRWTRTDADRLEASATAGLRAEDRGPRPGVRVRLRPVLELVARSPRAESADVRPVVVGPLELIFGGERLLVPVLVLLDDAEVDEGAVPDVAKCHFA